MGRVAGVLKLDAAEETLHTLLPPPFDPLSLL